MRYLSVLLVAFLISFKLSDTKLTAQQIIDKTIVASGADKVGNAQIKFKFRETEYIATRRTSGEFVLIRNQRKENFGTISDVISNNGFKRKINSRESAVLDSMANKYSNSVNSVHYFSVLPYGLNDKAVTKNRLVSSTIKGKEYYKIEVTFSENGGGEDFEDVFIYWVGKKDFLIDYLAYSYHTNGGGKRFRVLKEQCKKGGIRFVDYHNYKSTNPSISLVDLDKAFENNQLKKISEIVLEDIEVTILD
jgi:hypothetical protein